MGRFVVSKINFLTTLQHRAGIPITNNFAYLDNRRLTTLRELSQSTDICPSLHYFEDPNFLR